MSNEIFVIPKTKSIRCKEKREHVIVATQACVTSACLICTHDARGCTGPEGECKHNQGNAQVPLL